MTVRVRSIGAGGEKEYFSIKATDNVVKLKGDQLPVVATLSASFGTFKTANRTTAGTTIITDPDPDGSILLTDLIITTDKTANSDITVRFTDGTNTITVVIGDSVNNPVNIAIGFSGRWQGWRDARLEMVTTGTVNATVAAGYIKLPNGLSFEEWDALR